MIEWSDEQLQMQAAVREFVQKEVVPRRDELEHGDLAAVRRAAVVRPHVRDRRDGPGALRAGDRAVRRSRPRSATTGR